MRFGTRLVLAFSAVALFSTVLVGFVASALLERSTARFTQAIRSVRTDALVEALADYYARHGSWAGVDRWLGFVNRSGRLPGDGVRPPGSRSFERPERWMAGPPIERYRVVDADGVVVADSRGEALGARLDPATVRAQGRPIAVRGAVVGYLLATSPASERLTALEATFKRSVGRAVWLSAGISLGLALFFGAGLASRTTRPLQALEAAIRALARGDRSVRARAEGRDEIAELARAFNHMADEIDRLEAVRKNLIADVAHELRTPVSIMRGHLEAMLENPRAATPERLALLHDEALRMGHILQDLQNLSLADAGKLPLHRERTDLAALAEKVLAAFQPAIEDAGVEVRATFRPRPLWAFIDRARMEQVLVNVFGNALKVTPPGETIEIDGRGEGPCLSLAIRDRGPGFSPEDLPYVFERFYRSDKGRSRKDGGTGLGLAIAKGFVEAHGGSIVAANRSSGGAEVTIVLCDDEGGGVESDAALGSLSPHVKSR
ncbi:ATP-binding protein [Hydrogenibacillus sp. N12]|uniref:sensor histidine kinase n=1 Tax=Hydrogenibacillus sp. N12 TaxID=2866627 RepID=UPI001C7CB92D|nr:ATP-binding protein [Hydrogenibacillus sp. N12]QZA34028.1 HAMP domain-containing protein [Hydrogenibacillus sp. N12]